ncbi:MAG TPA: glycosyltransferase family 2 protein, partial [Gaiellaceae bacterium]|nr:glycosyltransferase family 2 protein [Gaiellaceae bacterium]
FAAGVNVALQQVIGAGRPVDVLLLNPDAEITPESVERLAVHLHRDGAGRCCTVAPRITGGDGAAQRTLWPFPSPARAWGEAFGLAKRPSSAQFAIGAVLLLRWEALQEVGLFDDRFFLYAEEADWQRRALERGWHAEECADVVALHAGGGTSTDPVRREALFHAAHETYIRKWHGAGGWWVYRAAAVAGATARAIVLRRERRREAARRALLYASGPRRRAGLSPRQR